MVPIQEIIMADNDKNNTNNQNQNSDIYRYFGDNGVTEKGSVMATDVIKIGMTGKMQGSTKRRN